MQIKGEEVDVRPLDPKTAAFWRGVCTEIGMHRYCRFKSCVRHRRCSTALVICWQVCRVEIVAMVDDVRRRRAAAEGAPPAPKYDGGARWRPISAAGRLRRD
jgi:hypothetical protein